MKKGLLKIIFAVILFVPFLVLAEGYVNITPASATIEFGGSASFTITAYNAIGDMTISSSNTSVATVSASSWETGMVEEKTTKTETFTVTGVGAGSATITINIDAVTFDEDAIPSPRTINIVVNPPKSTDAALSNLSVSNYTISPVFAASVTNYTLSVGADVDYVSINATARDSKAKSVVGKGSVPLNCGSNTKNVVVTAEDGVTTKTYTIVITRTCSSDSTLKSLTISKGSIDFNSNTKNYAVTLESNVNAITIEGVVNDTKSKIEGNGTKSLAYGVNTFVIVVTAQDGSKSEYVLSITRTDDRSNDNHLSSLIISDIDIQFDPEVTNYVANVDYSINQVTVDARKNDSKAEISGKVGKQNLVVGSNKIVIKVTAENGEQRVYTVTIIRKDEKGSAGDLNTDNTLGSLVVSGFNIEFTPEVENYSLKLNEMIDHLDIEAVASSDKSSINIIGNDNLKPGVNFITVEVVSESGDVKNYVIEVVLPGGSSTNAIDSVANNNKKSGGNLILTICCVCLLCGAAGLTIVLINKKKHNKELASATAAIEEPTKLVTETKKTEPIQEEKIPDISISDLKINDSSSTMKAEVPVREEIQPTISNEQIGAASFEIGSMASNDAEIAKAISSIPDEDDLPKVKVVKPAGTNLDDTLTSTQMVETMSESKIEDINNL